MTITPENKAYLKDNLEAIIDYELKLLLDNLHYGTCSAEHDYIDAEISILKARLQDKLNKESEQ